VLFSGASREGYNFNVATTESTFLNTSEAPESTPANTPNSPESALFGSVRNQNLVVAALLLALTLLDFGSVANNKFLLLDDPHYIANNVHVQALTWSNVKWAFTTTHMGHWHPLTWLLHMAQFHFFGMDPAGYHLTSLFLHGLNVVILFLLLQKATGAVWESAFVAALFAVHPLNVEEVAWLATTNGALSTFFGLLAIAAYGWYAAKPDWKRYLVVFGLFALSLMAKVIFIVLPFAILLLDVWPLKRMPFGARAGESPSRIPTRSLLWLVGEKIPLLLLALISSKVAIVAGRQNGFMASLAAVPLRIRVLNALYSYFTYIEKMFWPQNLSIFYQFPKHYVWWQLTAAALLLGTVTVFVVLRIKSKPYLAIGWFWYLGMLVPVIGLVQKGSQAMADRYTYVPLLGIFVMIAWGAAEWAGRSASRLRALGAGAIGVLLVLCVLSRVQLRRWHDSYTLFGYILEHSPDNPVAHQILGVALADDGRLGDAIVHFEATAALTPADPRIHYDLARSFWLQNQPDKAIPEYELSLKLHPYPGLAATAHTELAEICYRKSQIDQAQQHYLAAINLDPGRTETYVTLAVLLYSQGKPDAALELLSFALKNENNGMAYFWTGRILQDQRKLPEALAAYRAALKSMTGYAPAQQSIDTILANKTLR
jgi:tetratricopeptide (TPR) repeat protein